MPRALRNARGAAAPTTKILRRSLEEFQSLARWPPLHEFNFYLRGFKFLFILRKPVGESGG
jgi:hypothetical protein